MTLDQVRERMAEFLRGQDIDAVCAWPEEARVRRDHVAAAVSLRACQGGPGGFQDYLGERYNEAAGRWEELYGKRVKLTFGLDLYAPKGCGAAGLRDAFGRLAQALSQEGPEGLKVKELSCGAVRFEEGMGLFCCPVEAVCEGCVYAVAEEGGAFLEVIVRGDGRI